MSFVVHLRQRRSAADRGLISDHVERVEVEPQQLVVCLARARPPAQEGAGAEGEDEEEEVLQIPWRKTPATRRRELLLPEAGSPSSSRPLRAETRATLVAAMARGRPRLDELIAGSTSTAESISLREGCSVRRVNMTISLAFLAPDLVKAAIDGRLLNGMGVTCLRDLPAEWSRQRPMLWL